jgi:hypothetical protein
MPISQIAFRISLLLRKYEYRNGLVTSSDSAIESSVVDS